MISITHKDYVNRLRRQIDTILGTQNACDIVEVQCARLAINMLDEAS